MTTVTATRKGVGQEQGKFSQPSASRPVDYQDMVGHITMGTYARHNQRPDSPYRDYYAPTPDPLLESATLADVLPRRVPAPAGWRRDPSSGYDDGLDALGYRASYTPPVDRAFWAVFIILGGACIVGLICYGAYLLGRHLA